MKLIERVEKIVSSRYSRRPDNVSDREHDRIKVKEVTDGFSLVKRMRGAQNRMDMLTGEEDIDFIDMVHIEAREAETEVDEYLKKMEE